MGTIKRAIKALSSDVKPLKVEFKTQSSVNSFFGTREGSVSSANEILELKTDYTQEVVSLHVSTSRAVKNNFNYKIGYNKDVKIRLNNLGFYPDGDISNYDFKLSIFSDVGTFTFRSNQLKTLFVLEHPYLEDTAVASTNYAYGTLDVSKFDLIFQANSIQIMIDGIVIVTVTGIKQPTKFEGFEFYINNLNQGLGFSSVSLSNIEVTATANGVNFSSLENLPNNLRKLADLETSGFLRKNGDNIDTIDIPLSVQQIPTTQGKLFSETRTSYKLDGSEILKKKNEIRVLIACSSNGDTAINGWVNYLQAFLDTKGILNKNVSIGGTNSQSTLDRLEQDILTWNPSIIIEGTALWNEGLYSRNYNAVNNVLTNIGKLQNLVSQRGIKLFKAPILPYTGSVGHGNDSTDRIHSLAVFTQNMLDGISLGDGFVTAQDNIIYPPINVGDNIHQSEAGHKAIFKALNTYKITHPNLDGRTMQLSERGVLCDNLAVNQGSNQGMNLRFDSDNKLHSFTIALQVKWNTDFQPCTILSVFGTSLRIRHNANILSFCCEGDINTTITTSDPTILAKWNDIVVTYNRLQNIAKFFFNGTFVGQAGVNGVVPNEIEGIRFFGNAQSNVFQPLDHAYRNIFVYRTALKDNICTNFFKGFRPNASLILASRMDEIVPRGGRFLNFACSTLAIENDLTSISIQS